MADNVRLIITGESSSQLASLRDAFDKADVSVEGYADVPSVTADLMEAGPPTRLIIACSGGVSFDDAMEAALSLKEIYPAVPVILYGETVRDVLRLRCIEKGLDECLPRNKLVPGVLFLAKLLPPPESPPTPVSAPGTSSEQMFLRLNGDELSNALQFLCMTSREGRLTLTFESGKSGVVFTGDKTVTHAEFDEHEGIPAIARMLKNGDMEARFFDGLKPPRVTNETPISNVLIEASVLADESNS